MHSILQPRPDRPPLCLYTEPAEVPASSAGGSRLSLDSTTSEIYWRHARPKLLDRTRNPLKPQTLAEIEVSLGYWCRFTGDPTLREIGAPFWADGETTDFCEVFCRGLASLPGRRPGTAMAAATVRKHLVNLHGIWRWAGPRGPGYRAALNLFIDEQRNPLVVPWFELPAVEIDDDDEGRFFEVEDLKAIVKTGCLAATRPVTGLPPWLWWQSLVVFRWATGLRIGSTLAARYSWIDSRGVMTVPKEAMKTKRQQKVFLSQQATEAIDALRQPGRDRIFVWDATMRTFDRHWERIQLAAGIARDQLRGTHAVRRAHGDTMGQEDPEAARLSLGHADQATTDRHYRRARSKAAQAAARLPDLGGYRRRIEPATGQRMLF